MVLREVLVSPLTTSSLTMPLLAFWTEDCLYIPSFEGTGLCCVTFQVLLVLIYKHKSPMPPTAGQEPGAETEAEVVEECYLLAGSYGSL